MSRRKGIGLAFIGIVAAVTAGLVATSQLPSPVKAEVDQLRSSLELRDRESLGTPADPDDSRLVILSFRMFAFNTVNARTKLLAEPPQPGPAAAGVVVDKVRFENAIENLRTKGYLDLVARPIVMTSDRQPGLTSIGQTLGQQFHGIAIEARPTLCANQLLKLALDLKISSGPAGKANTLTVKQSVLVKDGQTCVLGGLNRKSTRCVPWIPGTGDWPLIGACRHDVLDDEEILLAVTVRLTSAAQWKEVWQTEIEPTP